MNEPKTILWIDGCIRGRELSRSYALAQAALEELQADKSLQVDHLDLMQQDLRPLYGDSFWARQAQEEAGNWEAPMFPLARQFAAADGLLIAAPYWEYSFPALLKCYLEQVSVAGITFRYTPQGVQGLCQAKRMLFCTTRGGIATGEAGELEQGGRYLKALCLMYGVPEMEMVAAEGLDIDGADVAGKMAQACQQARQAAQRLRKALKEETSDCK